MAINHLSVNQRALSNIVGITDVCLPGGLWSVIVWIHPTSGFITRKLIKNFIWFSIRFPLWSNLPVTITTIGCLIQPQHTTKEHLSDWRVDGNLLLETILRIYSLHCSSPVNLGRTWKRLCPYIVIVVQRKTNWNKSICCHMHNISTGRRRSVKRLSKRVSKQIG